jgi:SulP family sulfate permease
MVESLLCGASAGRMTGVRLDNDRELVAQGIGNILSPLLGGIPATAAIARTSVAIKSGAQTRLVGIFHAIILLISMLVLGPVMSNIPLSALAGVLIVTAFRMNEWHTIKYMFSHKFKGAILKFLVTMIATIVFDLTVAILIGVLVALVLLVGRLSKLNVKIEEVQHERLEGKEGIFDPIFENAKVAVLSGSVIFPNTNQVEDLAQGFEGASAAIISMRGVSHMDISGAQAFAELVEALQKKEIKVFFSGVSEDVMKMMERSDIVKTVGAENFYGRVDQVILK